MSREPTAVFCQKQGNLFSFSISPVRAPVAVSPPTKTTTTQPKKQKKKQEKAQQHHRRDIQSWAFFHEPPDGTPGRHRTRKSHRASHDSAQAVTFMAPGLGTTGYVVFREHRNEESAVKTAGRCLRGSEKCLRVSGGRLTFFVFFLFAFWSGPCRGESGAEHRRFGGFGGFRGFRFFFFAGGGG